MAEGWVQPDLSQVRRNEDGKLCQTIQSPPGREVNIAEGVVWGPCRERGEGAQSSLVEPGSLGHRL